MAAIPADQDTITIMVETGFPETMVEIASQAPIMVEIVCQEITTTAIVFQEIIMALPGPETTTAIPCREILMEEIAREIMMVETVSLAR